MVVVRCGRPVKDNVDRLQNRLSTLSCAGASFRLGLCRWLPAAEAIVPMATREMVPSGRSMETLAAARAITGLRQIALISTRSTGMPQNWWATPLSRTVRSTRSPVCEFPTIARRAWRDSDSAQHGRDPAQEHGAPARRCTDLASPTAASAVPLSRVAAFTATDAAVLAGLARA